MTKTFPLLPDNTCPELAGYKLPELPRSQEDDVKAMAKEEFNNIDNPIRSGIDNHSYKTGFTEGYRKAREKFEFSRQDLIDLVEGLKVYTSETQSILGDDTWEASDFVDMFIDNRTPRTPIAIEVEMEREYIIPSGKDVKYIYVDIPATNPDGTVKVVRWVYE